MEHEIGVKQMKPLQILLPSFLVCGLATAVDADLYLANALPDGTSQLHTLDTTSGLPTYVGEFEGTISSLAPSDSADLLYGSIWQSVGLTHIGPQSATSTVVGGVYSEGMAFDHTTGKLYGAFDGNLRELGPADGSVIKNLPSANADVEGLAYGNGVVYGLNGTGSGGGNPGELLAYDIASQSWSTIGQTGLTSADEVGLAFDPESEMLFLKDGNDTNLYKVDPATAEKTLVGDTGLSGASGMAFLDSPKPVPDPSSLVALIGMATMGLVVAPRRCSRTSHL